MKTIIYTVIIYITLTALFGFSFLPEDRTEEIIEDVAENIGKAVVGAAGMLVDGHTYHDRELVSIVEKTKSRMAFYERYRQKAGSIGARSGNYSLIKEEYNAILDHAQKIDSMIVDANNEDSFLAMRIMRKDIESEKKLLREKYRGFDSMIQRATGSRVKVDMNKFNYSY